LRLFAVNAGCPHGRRSAQAKQVPRHLHRQLDRKHNGKPDLFCVVWLQYANGKAGWKTVGAHSKGMCPARASVLRKYCKGSST
jgi:hypothetical protein